MRTVNLRRDLEAGRNRRHCPISALEEPRAMKPKFPIVVGLLPAGASAMWKASNFTNFVASTMGGKLPLNSSPSTLFVLYGASQAFERRESSKESISTGVLFKFRARTCSRHHPGSSSGESLVLAAGTVGARRFRRLLRSGQIPHNTTATPPIASDAPMRRWRVKLSGQSDTAMPDKCYARRVAWARTNARLN